MSTMRRAGLTTLAGAAGAAAAYLLDPDRGRARRAQARDQLHANAPKGRVSLNAEDGVVFIRGEVETQAQIDMLVSGAQRVDGVREVRSLMHLPGTPAPTAA